MSPEDVKRIVQQLNALKRAVSGLQDDLQSSARTQAMLRTEIDGLRAELVESKTAKGKQSVNVVIRETIGTGFGIGIGLAIAGAIAGLCWGMLVAVLAVGG